MDSLREIARETFAQTADFQAVADAVIQAHEARRWQAIESAPKDGTWILTWVGGVAKPFPYICAWSDSYSIHGLGGNWNDGLCQMGIEVTHWTPIPAPPQEVECEG
jgi:hypothetical protein